MPSVLDREMRSLFVRVQRGLFTARQTSSLKYDAACMKQERSWVLLVHVFCED